MRRLLQPLQPESITRRTWSCCAAIRSCVLLGLVLTATGLAPSRSALADGVRFLQCNRDAFQARVDLIQQARSQISMAYYAVDTDQVPIALIELLRQASQRGVKVRILVDGLISRLPSDFERYLISSGIEIRVYHRTHDGNLQWLNQRLHNKMLMVDGEHLIIGSRNLQDEHFGLVEDFFIDCDAYINGEIAGRAQHYFDRIWCAPDVTPAPDRDSLGLDILGFRPTGRTAWSETWRDAEGPKQYQQLLDLSIDRVACRLRTSYDTGTDWSALATPIKRAELCQDRCTDKSYGQMQRQIIAMINSARSCLMIESPYPAFSKPVRDAILAASQRGVRVTMLTNSLKTTDRLAVYSAYQNNKRRLLRSGVELYEYCGPGTLHAKTMVIDNHRCMIGSYNFDARSDKHNLEIVAAICGTEAASELRQLIQCRIAKSDRISKGILLLDTPSGDKMFRRSRMMIKRLCVEFYRGLL